MNDNLKPVINLAILIALFIAFVIFFLYREIVIIFFAAVIAIFLQGRRQA